MFRTVSSAVTFRGVGLHCGLPVAATVESAPPGAGLTFRCGADTRAIPARHDFVVETRYRTSLGNADGAHAGTVEHLLAALCSCGVTDASVILDGPEVPALDGSAADFARGLIRAGFRDAPGTRRAIRILEPVFVHLDGRSAAFLPAPRPEMHFTVRYDDPAIGSQTRSITLTPQSILAELIDSRTFGLLSDVETSQGHGVGAWRRARQCHRGRPRPGA